MLDVGGKIAAMMSEGVGVFVERFEQFQDFRQLFLGKFLSAGKIAHANLFRAEFNQDFVQPRVVIHILDPLLARNLVQGRLGDIDKTVLHKRGHLPVEKRQQQRADVRSVHVGIGHDDDLVVAELLDGERAFTLAIADPGADGGDHGPDFVVLKDLVEARLFNVNQLPANGQDGLELPVAPLFRRAACGVALDNEQFRVRRIAVGTIGQLAGQATARKRAFAHRFPRLARRLARPRGEQAFLDHLFRDGRIGVEMGHQTVVNDRCDDAVDLRVDELHLRLRLEARVGQLDAQDADQAFPDVIPGNRRVFFLQQIVLLRILVDGAGQGGAETGQMRATVRVRDGIGEAKDLVVVAVGVLHHAIHEHFVLLPVDDDRLGMEHLLVAAQLPYELLDAGRVKEHLLLLVALVLQGNLHAGIQERQLAQAIGQNIELEFGGDRENGRIRFEGDERARVFGLADHAELLGRHPARKFHRIHFSIARNLDLEPIGERVHALGADAVQTAGILVSALAEFAAGVQVRQHQFDRRDLPLGMHVHRDAPPIVANRHRTIHVNRDLNLVAISRKMFVDGIVQHFEDAMVQSAFVRVADIHPGTLADSLQTFELVDLRRIIFLRRVGAGFHLLFRFYNVIFSHKNLAAGGARASSQSTSKF